MKPATIIKNSMLITLLAGTLFFMGYKEKKKYIVDRIDYDLKVLHIENKHGFLLLI